MAWGLGETWRVARGVARGVLWVRGGGTAGTSGFVCVEALFSAFLLYVRWVLVARGSRLTSSAIVSLTLFSRSSVACLRARRPDVEGCVPLFLSRSEENMTLYRSNSVVGISTANNGLSGFGVMAAHSSST